jgi:hypothetical protein
MTDAGASTDPNIVHIEMPDKIKVFEESAELVDFFAAPPTTTEVTEENSTSASTNMSTSTSNIRMTTRKSDDVLPPSSQTAGASLSSADEATPVALSSPTESTQTFIQVSTLDDDYNDDDDDEKPTQILQEPSCCFDCRAAVRAVLSVNGDDGVRCGKYCTGARIYNIVSFLINIFAIVVEILKNTRDETTDGRRPWYPAPYPTPRALRVSSIALGGMFAIELTTRLIVSETLFTHRRSRYRLTTYYENSEHSLKGKELPFFQNPFNYLDALSCAWWETSIFRVLRVLRLSSRWNSSTIVYDTVRKSARPICVSMLYLLSFLTLIASLLYFVESCYYTGCELPDLLSTTYFLIITITTVGYGDIVPTTVAGRVIAVGVMLTGSFFLAMPLSVIGTEYERAFSKHEKMLAKQDKTGKLQRELEKRQQRVTVQQRRVRAMQLGYKLADLIEENYESKIRRQLLHPTGTMRISQSEWQLTKDRALIKMAQQLLRDILILFNINLEEVRAIEEEILDIRSSMKIPAAVARNSGMSNKRADNEDDDNNNDDDDDEEEAVTTWSEAEAVVPERRQPAMRQGSASSNYLNSDSLDLDQSLKLVRNVKNDSQNQQNNEHPEQLPQSTNGNSVYIDNDSSNQVVLPLRSTSQQSAQGTRKHHHSRRKSAVDIITDILADEFKDGKAASGAAASTPHQLHGDTMEQKKVLFRNPTLAASMLKKKLDHEKRKSMRMERHHHGHHKHHGHHGQTTLSQTTGSDNTSESERVSYTKEDSTATAGGQGGQEDTNTDTNTNTNTNTRIITSNTIQNNNNPILSPMIKSTIAKKVVGLHNVTKGTLEKRTSSIAGIGSASNYYSAYTRSGRAAQRRGSKATSSNASGNSNKSLTDAWDASNGMYRNESPIKNVRIL